MKPVPVFYKDAIYVKEGGFIRLILDLCLRGIASNPSLSLVLNKVLFGGKNLIKCMKKGKTRPIFNFRGYSHAFKMTAGKDLFFDIPWVGAYVLT